MYTALEFETSDRCEHEHTGHTEAYRGLNYTPVHYVSWNPVSCKNLKYMYVGLEFHLNPQEKEREEHCEFIIEVNFYVALHINVSRYWKLV